MKLYVADYLGDTHHLGVIEHGAYLLLLMAMWRAGGSIPASDANLARMARCSTEQWAEVRDVVLPYFKRTRGRLTHKRLAAEMAKYESTSGKRSEAGKLGAAKKANKNRVEAAAIASNGDTQLPSYPEPEPEPQREKDKPSLSPAETAPRTRRGPLIAIPDGFPDMLAMAAAEQTVAAAGVKLSVTSQARRFRRHAEAKGRQERDWSAAWLGWVENEVEKAPAEPTEAAPAAATWLGPPEVLAILTAHQLGGYAAYLTWRDVPERVLVTTSPTIHAKLQPCLADLHQIGAGLLLEKARAA